ncbi:glycosyltransferase family 4 protein [Novosphingobium sp.]|uniref:glycosyltransferase family 4 protein n=1 Tax=Novosphingobium sp. TaxID=1874826 RepID=UPI0038B86844
MSGRPLVVFGMAYFSGMGRVTAALAEAAGRHGASAGVPTVLICPEMEIEPEGIARIRYSRPRGGKGKVGKLLSLLRYNLDAARAVWANTPRGAIFLTVDLFSTVPLSLLPPLAARLRGARLVLNLHDFYPHAPRYPRKLRGLERWFFRLAYRRFDRIATMTDAQIGRLVSEAGIDRARIVPISHGAFPIAGVVPPTTDEPVRLLAMGAIRRNKSTLASIVAMAEPGVAAVLRLAGAPRPEEQDYWALCREALVRLPGAEVDARFIPDDQLPSVLSGVAGFLSPYEGFDSSSGVSILAVTNRIPLIATPCAVPEELRDHADAWYPIAEPVSAQTIAEAVRGFQALSPEQRAAMAGRAHALFASRNHWDEAISAIVASLSD